jgi:hypothetical protein
MGKFKDLWSDGNYVVHFKYSGILNIVFITLMYGMGLPLLFPVAAFNFFNQWVCERITVAYYTRLPPALDDKLTVNALKIVKFAPLIMLMNSYWMFTNK